MYRPTNKELDAIIAMGVTTAVVLVPAGLGAVGAVLGGILCMVAEYWGIARKSARTSKQAGS